MLELQNTMNLQEKFEYWLDIAQYDLKTAEVMFETGRWVYVIFMCQQAIEKLIKGLYLLFIDDDIPKNHDINYILSKFENKLDIRVEETKKKLFAKLSAFYLNNRYPGYKEKLSISINKEDAKNTLEDTKEAYTWLLTLKP